MKRQSDFMTTLIAVGIVCVGLILIVVGQIQIYYGTINISNMLVGTGSTLAFIGLINWLYEMYTKKKLHSELVELILGSKQVSDSGISGFFVDSHDINFKDAIAESRSVTTIFSYNSRFLQDYEYQISRMLNNDGVANFIFLAPNSKTIDLMKELGWEKDSMTAHYGKIERYIKSLKNNKGTVSVSYIDVIPRYSLVKLDNVVYLILNTCSNKRQPVPAVKIKIGSPMWEFICNDIENIKDVQNKMDSKNGR